MSSALFAMIPLLYYYKKKRRITFYYDYQKQRVRKSQAKDFLRNGEGF
jgi:hypothetical protein